MDYRRVEVLHFAESSRPSLHWAGRPSSMQVSLTHSRDLSCAGISQGLPLGVDAEQVVAREGAFYRQTFAPEERRWAALSATATHLPEAWLYSLLWTLKESALKAQVWGRATSLWDFPTLALRPMIEPETLSRSYCGRRLGHSIACFQALLPAHGRQLSAAVTATDRQILSLLHA